MVNKEKKLVPRLRFDEFEYNNHWIQKMVGEYYTFKNGLNKGKKYFGHGIPIVNYMDVFKTRRLYTENLKGRVNVSLSEQKNYSVLKGDIFFTRTSETLEEIGYPSVMLDSPEKAVFSGFVLRARPKRIDPLDIDFKSYVFYTKSFRNEMIKTSSMSTRALTSGTAIKKMKFKFPENMDEQKQIGNFFKKIDQMIQLQQSKVNKVKDLKSAYLSEMFPKEEEKYPKKRFEGFTKPWKLTKFNEIAAVERGLTYHPSDIVEKGGVRVLRSSNIDEDTFITKDDDVFVNENAINIEFSQKQNILITSANGSPHLVGKHAILEQLETPSVHGGFMLLARTASPYFLNASMSSDWYRKFIRYHVAGGGGSIGNIKKSDLEHQLIYIPSKEEQEKIGQFFKNLDNQISIEEEKLAKLEKLKQAYLNDMFV